MKHYNLICMSFDGDYVVAGRDFENVDTAWEYSNDMGSTWYFYPFHFVATQKSIVDVPDSLFAWATRKRIKTIARIFKEHSEKPEIEGMDCDEFAFSL